MSHVGILLLVYHTSTSLSFLTDLYFTIIVTNSQLSLLSWYLQYYWMCTYVYHFKCSPSMYQLIRIQFSLWSYIRILFQIKSDLFSSLQLPSIHTQKYSKSVPIPFKYQTMYLYFCLPLSLFQLIVKIQYSLVSSLQISPHPFHIQCTLTQIQSILPL